MIYRYRVYFGAKSKDYDATMKRTVKEHPLLMNNILKTCISALNEILLALVYLVTKRIFKVGKVLPTTFQRANLKMFIQLFVIIVIILGY